MQESFVEGLIPKTLIFLYHASDPYHLRSSTEYLRNICFLHGLQDKYTNFQETTMSSGANINMDQVFRWIQDSDQLKKPADKAARACQSEGSNKGPKCYNCQECGHIL